MSKNVLAKYEIINFSDGTVQIHGPIDNLLLFRRVMVAAEKAVLDHIVKKIEQDMKEASSGIVVPQQIVQAQGLKIVQ